LAHLARRRWVWVPDWQMLLHPRYPFRTAMAWLRPLTITARADPAVPRHGREMPIAATSMALRGDMARRLGDGGHPRDRPGADRSPRPARDGQAGPSTTGATKKHRCGIPDSTSGDSISSESGSRCNKPSPSAPASLATRRASPRKSTPWPHTAIAGGARAARLSGTSYTSRVKLRMTVGVCARW
jgi:hypothetical protein